MNYGCSMLTGAIVLLASTAAAAEPPPLTDASAVWAENGQVELSFSYEGGACEETGQPEVTASEEYGTDVVTVPTVETAEVCTMQIVQVEFEGTIPVEPTTETLSVIVLDPDGQPKAAGHVEIGASSSTGGDEAD